MPALVGLGVGDARGAHQAEPDRGGRPAVRTDGTGDVVTVGGVGDERDAVAGFADVHPAVPADLETGRLPAGVGVGGPLDVAELDLGAGVRGAQVDGEARLEDLLRLVPVDVRLEVDAGAARPHGDRLGDAGSPAEGADHADRAGQRRFLGHGDRVGLQQVGVTVPVVLVDVPGVPAVGQVRVEAEQIALAGEDFAARP